MNDERLSDLLRSAPVPAAERALKRTVDACRARAAARASATVAGAPRLLPRRRAVRMVTLAGAGAVLVVGALAVLRGASSETEGTSFGSFAAIASAQPEAEFQHIEWEALTRHSWPPHYVQGEQHPDVVEQSDRISLWVGDDQRYERGTHDEGRGRAVEVEYLFDRRSGLTCFPNSMRVPFSITYESGRTFRYEGGDDEGASCIADWSAQQSTWTGPDLPTDPGSLREALEDEIRNPPESLRARAERDARGSRVDREDPADTEPAGPLPVPLSQATELDRFALIPALGLGPWNSRALPLEQQLYSRIITYLLNPHSSPELRAALFEVLADLEGAVLKTGQTDSLGREAALVTYMPPRTQENEGATVSEDLYLDPETSEVLEIAILVESERGAAADKRVWGSYVETFTVRESANSLPPEAEPLLDELERARAEG